MHGKYDENSSSGEMSSCLVNLIVAACLVIGVVCLVIAFAFGNANHIPSAAIAFCTGALVTLVGPRVTFMVAEHLRDQPVYSNAQQPDSGADEAQQEEDGKADAKDDDASSATKEEDAS